MKLAVRLVGYAVVAVSLWYVGDSFFEQYQSLVDFDWGWVSLSILLAGAVLYSAALNLMGMSWVVLLVGRRPSLKQILGLLSVYGRANLGKYLPGNFFHFVGRQYLGKNLGVSQVRLGLASVAEVVFSLISASLLVLGLQSFGFIVSDSIYPESRSWIFAVALCAGVVATGCYKLRGTLFHRLPEKVAAPLRQLTSLPLGFAFILNVSFFLCAAAIATLSFALLSTTEVYLPHVAAAYLVAWVVGYVVPGASGGVGIREALIIAQLTPVGGEAFAVAFAIFMRCQTILADVILFVFAVSLRGPDKTGLAND